MIKKTTRKQGTRFDKAVGIFNRHNGMLRTAQALREGVHPGTLYAMRDSGVLEVVSRGVYRLADREPFNNPDLTTVTIRVPGSIICLISALAFHEITTQIPHEVHVALPRGAERPRIDHPPIKTYRFTGEAFTEGVEIHEMDGVGVRMLQHRKNTRRLL